MTLYKNKNLNKRKFFRTCKENGFTLLEVMAAIAIGIIATGTIVWSISGAQGISKVHNACVKAAAINTAKSMLVNYKGSDAIKDYNDANNDAKKFELIRKYIPYTGNDISLTDYTPRTFQFSMKGINEKVIITHKGRKIDY